MIGHADDVMGERVCAVVVPSGAAQVSLADLREFAAASLAAFKCPEALCIVAELPRTATDKVSKEELRRQPLGRLAQIERLF